VAGSERASGWLVAASCGPQGLQVNRFAHAAPPADVSRATRSPGWALLVLLPTSAKTAAVSDSLHSARQLRGGSCFIRARL